MVTIKADPGSQQRLLDLQATDSALAQLDHRRRTLPEHAELARLKSEQAAVRSDLVAADTAVSDLELEQAKAESDLEPVRNGWPATSGGSPTARCRTPRRCPRWSPRWTT